MNTRALVLVATALLPGLTLARPAAGQPRQDPTAITLSPVVTRVLNDPINTEQTHLQTAIFHGMWELVESRELTVAERAAIALGRFQLNDPSLSDAAAPTLLRATAALWRGEPAAAAKLLEADGSAQAAVVRAQALEQLGRLPDAVATLTPWRDKLRDVAVDDAAELTAAAEAIIMLARLEGRPAHDYQLALGLFTRACDEIDRLYFPAHLATARLLMAKDNNPEAAQAVRRALELNPNSGEGWYLLGRILIDSFTFDLVENCVKKLRAVNSEHLLADLLEAQMYLTQKDPGSARHVVESALARHREHRGLLALLAATEALSHDDEALEVVLRRFEELSPGSAEALYTVGRYYSFTRQYADGEAMLRRAIAREPNWARPRVELGLLLMQSGDEEQAEVELRAAVELDPFNRRAGNQLKLAEHLRQYDVLRTENFIIKHKPGIDAVLAQDMAEQLETIYREVTGAFEHRPKRKTLIEIMPDEEWFGVRITGMPDIWTIAAATGDVIALTPPRDGARQRGSFDWARVIRHEFVHTVTLDQTRNRISHWFTEACAVSQEPGGRDYDTCRLLAVALAADQLFTLDAINWGFVRPRTPRDRPLAYAQAHWMLQYITAQFGHTAVIRMLDLYRQGVKDPDTIRQATGQDEAQFMAGFKDWARQQVESWGLGPHPGDDRVAQLVSADRTVSAEKLAELHAEFPDHPELLRLEAERAVKHEAPERAMQAVTRYALARPVDPWSDRMIAQLALRLDRPAEAVGALEQLDRQESSRGDWAAQLAKVHRSAGQLDAAANAARRALHREPYNASYRELAAAIDLQRNEAGAALRQVRSLTLLEPDRAMHFVRLATLSHRLGKADEARQAAEQARKLDPKAPVDRFLN